LLTLLLHPFSPYNFGLLTLLLHPFSPNNFGFHTLFHPLSPNNFGFLTLFHPLSLNNSGFLGAIVLASGQTLLLQLDLVRQSNRQVPLKRKHFFREFTLDTSHQHDLPHFQEKPT
jgi:hypothetical protein